MNGRRNLLAVGALCAVLAGVAVDAAAQQTAPAATQYGPIAPLPPAESIDEGLELTELEKQILAPAFDRRTQLDEPGLYVMLRRAAALPALDTRQWERLDRPAYENLIERPGDYRLRPIRLELNVSRVQRLTAGEGLARLPRWWPRGKPVWTIDGIVPAGTEYDPNRPIRVISVVEPDLGRPVETRDGADIHGVPGPQIEVAAVFYKVYETRDTAGRLRRYPVLIAWQLRGGRRRPAGGGGTPWSLLVSLILLVGVLVFGFIMLKRRIAQSRARFVEARRLRAGQRADREQGGADETVDPELKQIAEEYRRREQEQ